MAYYKTGQVAPRSGLYRVVGQGSYEITLVRGDRIPPYRRQSALYVLVDKTIHRGLI